MNRSRVTVIYIVLLSTSIIFLFEGYINLSLIFSSIVLAWIVINYYKCRIDQNNYALIKHEEFPDRISLLNRLENSKHLKYKTLILINIDSFEDINDFFGYDFGDEALRMVFYWLKNNLPDKESELYKLEADNYAIFTKRYKTKKELAKYLNFISTKIIDTSFTIQDNEIDIGFTIGAAMNEENLLKLTHTAYKKSKLNKTQFEIYTKDPLNENPQEKNIRINKLIKKAIQSNNIIPYFQPIYSIKMNKIDKYESLMRIRMENQDMMMPVEFLHIAKKSKLYPKLTKEMFSKVVDNLALKKYEFSINISVDDILDKNTSKYILNKLEQNDIGSWLVFEILESEGIENYKEVTNFLRNVKSLGAKIAIDDFGSGYSNFEYLLKLDIDFLKIDGSLIRNIDINEDTQIITSTIVEFAKKLRIKTIAEFVHNKNIYDIVKSLGFDYAQGYYIGEPNETLEQTKDLSYLKCENEPNLFNFWK